MSPDFNERVRTRAYFLWEKEGRPKGADMMHWLTAEAEETGKGRPSSGVSAKEAPPATKKPAAKPKPAAKAKAAPKAKAAKAPAAKAKPAAKKGAKPAAKKTPAR